MGASSIQARSSNMKHATIAAVWFIALAMFSRVGIARGQAFINGSFGTETEEDHLAKEVEDPTAILTQLDRKSVV